MPQRYRYPHLAKGLLYIAAAVIVLGGCMFTRSAPDMDSLNQALRGVHPAVADVKSETNLNGFYYKIFVKLTIREDVVDEELYKAIIRCVDEQNMVYNSLDISFRNESHDFVVADLSRFSFDVDDILETSTSTVLNAHEVKRLAESF